MKTPKVFSLFLFLSLLLAGCSDNPRADSESRLKKVLLLNATFVNDNDLNYPDLSSAAAAKASLATTLANVKARDEGNDKKLGWSDDIFIDALSGQPFTPNANLSKISAAKIEMPMNVIAFYAPVPNGDERLVGYADGHIDWVKEAEWPIKKIGGQVP